MKIKQCKTLLPDSPEGEGGLATTVELREPGKTASQVRKNPARVLVPSVWNQMDTMLPSDWIVSGNWTPQSRRSGFLSFDFPLYIYGGREKTGVGREGVGGERRKTEKEIHRQKERCRGTQRETGR